LRLLLDTCVFLWAASEPERLSSRARETLGQPGHTCWVSGASIWEIVVKHDLGKLVLPDLPQLWVTNVRERLGVAARPNEEADALHLARLPTLHRDPFDRILVAQALVHGLTIVTPDEVLGRYPAPTLW
jgi:PIN domain nuclease of toxin-antitoxin system